MKKLLLVTGILLAPCLMQAQEIGLAENYKTKKEKRLAKFKPLTTGNLTFSAGLVNVGTPIGALVDFNAEYMINNRVGLRGSFSSNNMSGQLRPWGQHRYGMDITYHFIQSKRWDVYAFAGVALNRYNYSYYSPSINNDVRVNYNNFNLNGGVGARYKITPSFGLEAELGTQSSIGIFKRFNLRSLRR